LAVVAWLDMAIREVGKARGRNSSRAGYPGREPQIETQIQQNNYPFVAFVVQTAFRLPPQGHASKLPFIKLTFVYIFAPKWSAH